MPHTPGPWHYGRKNWRNEEQETKWYVHGDERLLEEDEDDEDVRLEVISTAVCVVEGNATSHPTCEDNARLIAAAPELLAALETAVRWLRRLEQEYPGCLNEDAIDRHLMRAINKTRGA